MAFDVIGDVHGHALALDALLRKLGYREQLGAWRHPKRTAVFVCDLIDRGPVNGARWIGCGVCAWITAWPMMASWLPTDGREGPGSIPLTLRLGYGLMLNAGVTTMEETIPAGTPLETIISHVLYTHDPGRTCCGSLDGMEDEYDRIARTIASHEPLLTLASMQAVFDVSFGKGAYDQAALEMAHEQILILMNERL